jgi:hypothetical protein
MKTLLKNLRILSRILSLGGLIILGACGGNSNQATLPAPGPDQGTVDNNAPAAEGKPVVALAPTAQLKTCYTYSFISNREDHAQNVFLADTCNSQPVRKLTANHGTDLEISHLAFNSNGTKLAFDHLTTDSFPLIPGLTLMTPPANPSQFATSIELNSADLGGTGSSDFFPRSLAFEPNGGRTAFVAVIPQNAITAPGVTTQIFPQSLKLFDPSTGLHDLVENSNDSLIFDRILWLPDGDHLIFAKQVESKTEIHLYDLASGQEGPLRESASNSALILNLDGFAPTLSPDGKTLAFVQRNKLTGKDQILACNLQIENRHCNNVIPLATNGANSSPAFTPDGKFILFTSDRDGNREIYQMKADGSEQVRLTEEDADDVGPAVHPVSFQVPAN